jgi:hypothetical protein
MEPIAALLPSLRYLVFADRNRRHLVAAFVSHAEARQYLHLHCPCSGEVVDRREEEQCYCRTRDQ